MIKQINIERTEKGIVRIIVIYDNNGKLADKIVNTFDELTIDEVKFFRENAQNMWWFGEADGVSMYIVNTYKDCKIVK